MNKPLKKRYAAPIIPLLLFFAFMFFIQPRPAASAAEEVVSGPYSLAIHAGAYSDSAAVGADARADFLNPALNVHIFGTVDQLGTSNGIGMVDRQRYGLGVAFSHTYSGKKNVFVGASVINELNEFFGHVYLGGKVKVSDNALLSASYGVGLGPDNLTSKNLTRFLKAQSADWGKIGAVVVGPSGIKTNLYYYLKDPGGRNISGIEGEVSYPVTEAFTVGVSGSGDLNTNTDIDREWNSQLFVAYAFGGQRGSVIDVALDKNNPVAYPKVIPTVGGRTAAGEPIFPPEPE